MEPIIWEGSTLKLLDQRLLPGEIKYLSCTTVEEVAEAIQKMVVRGAPAIGIAASFGLVLGAKEHGARCRFSDLQEMALKLKNTRPTAVNLAWALERLLAVAEEIKDGQAMVNALEEEAGALFKEDLAINKAIGENGAALLSPDTILLTHCNAGALATAGYGTALGVIRSAFAQGKIKRVYVNETRPFLQGSRLTALELREEGIPLSVICDSAAGYFMSQGLIDAVILGADRITANGDVANKIGTYSLAVLAKENKIPFYVAAPCSTIDYSLQDCSEIIIEERNAEEITHFNGRPIVPEGVEVLNPAFDLTPARLITAIITEKGVIEKPDQSKMKAWK